tara:strand:+ start:50422 stop:51558 length:1137 start_codon:yes stop_codon:yes gene_type:complete
MTTKKIMLIAGEASGEEHGASLVKAISSKSSNIIFTGIGGREMRAAGVDTFADCAELAVMGFTDVIGHLPTIIKIFKATVEHIKQQKPDLLILIDYPGFNLRLAKKAKQLGVKVLFYISPQVWAWRQGRVKSIAKVVDHMAVIFPFEVDFYSKANIPVTYVGHPLTHSVKSNLTTEQAREKFGIATTNKVVGLLPGSRNREIQRLLPTILESARLIKLRVPNTQFIMPLASTIDKETIQTYLKRYAVDVKIVEGDNYNVMQACDALITSSGTATLEAALMTTPMVIIYKVPFVTGLIMRHLIKIKHVGLANIVAGKNAVPELLQERAKPKYISQAIIKMLTDAQYQQQIVADLTEVKTNLGHEDGSENVAKIALNMLA